MSPTFIPDAQVWTELDEIAQRRREPAMLDEIQRTRDAAVRQLDVWRRDLAEIRGRFGLHRTLHTASPLVRRKAEALLRAMSSLDQLADAYRAILADDGRLVAGPHKRPGPDTWLPDDAAQSGLDPSHG